jgi:hypothetical protein
MRLALSACVLALSAAAATPAPAQRWGDGLYGWDRAGAAPVRHRGREGKVEVTRFVADDAAAQALGHGAIVVKTAGEGLVDAREQATFEAAVIDRLAAVGYDTAGGGADGQTLELSVSHAQVEAPEPPHKPVHGAMSVGVDSRGGSYAALAVGVDARKPLKALVSTRMEARIRDSAGTVLWEGRADIATRLGDDKWSEQAIAGKLADALFSGFPGRNGETIAAR